MTNRIIFFVLPLLVNYLLGGCKERTTSSEDTVNNDVMNTDTFPKGTFGYDVHFVRKHQQVVVLHNEKNNSQVLICPKFQGRVLTSTAQGLSGRSFGWLNYDRIASEKITPHIQSYGGEDRFWIGPQGGQYTIYFNPGDPFDFDHWFTPAPFDTEPFDLTFQSDTRARFHKKMKLTNYSGSSFEVEVNREIKLLDNTEIAVLLGLASLDSVQVVGFESKNEMINAGKNEWKKASGLLSVWILGMFPGTDAATVIIPYRTEAEPLVVNEYFTDVVGKLPRERLYYNDAAIYYKADGNYCSKIGIRQTQAKEFFGSYDSASNVLTIIQYSLPKEPADYVNALWAIQKDPYNGDVINSYNDGTLDHSPASPTFYELESSSPARELNPGESITHIHRTIHFTGTKNCLDKISRTVLGVVLGR